MGNIVLLDDLTINKIAAGEVIERPASVVKELVENSIDAGATNISVEIKNGGISYIRITDNGKGFLQDDMEIAFERHATSKIRKADDLETVKSMGFRGEALASIAAIARVELISRTSESENGYKVIVEGGNIINKEIVGCPKGTTITVENLFYNTPVRYKFLKKDFTESGYIEDVITRIALINPGIALKLINAGKTIVQTSGNGEIKDVVYGIYGKEIAENIIKVNYEDNGMLISGVVGKPSIARSNRSNQLFFVNKRFVKDKTLSSAAEQAFKGMLTIGKYGFLILNVDIDPHKVDVNVHPAKLEVRFEEESNVFKLVYHAIKDCLLNGDLFGEKGAINNSSYEESKSNEQIDKEVQEQENTLNKFREQYNQIFNSITKVTSNINPESSNFVDTIKAEDIKMDKQNLEMKEETGNIVEDLYTNQNSKIEIDEIIAKAKKDLEERLKAQEKKGINIESIIEDNETEKLDLVVKDSNVAIVEKQESSNAENIINQSEKDVNEIVDNKNTQEIESPKVNEFVEMYSKLFGTNLAEKQENIQEDNEKYNPVEEAETIPVENVSMFDGSSIKSNTNYKLIGVAFSTYIIVEIEKEIYIIDQHAAHERIMYEKVKKNYYSDEIKDSQLMLLPDIITLTHKEMGIAKDNMQLFEKAGFVLEEFGENTIKLSGVPNICIDLDTKNLFLETLDEINTVARTAKQEIEEKFIATVACKAAVKANMALSVQEIDNLMQELLTLPNPFTCPHGRPTAIRMSKTDIEKKFSRR